VSAPWPLEMNTLRHRHAGRHLEVRTSQAESSETHGLDHWPGPCGSERRHQPSDLAGSRIRGRSRACARVHRPGHPLRRARLVASPRGTGWWHPTVAAAQEIGVGPEMLDSRRPLFSTTVPRNRR